MFVSPRAMPSFVARLRWVMRESFSTSSSSLRSRCASISMGGLFTGRSDGFQGEFCGGPVVERVDADSEFARHDVRRRTPPVKARLHAVAASKHSRSE